MTERPENGEYSTVYVGKTSSFAPYGDFSGVAETVDSGNENKSDNAFVILDSASSDEQILSVISHETEHLLGLLAHDGEGLSAYAAENWINGGNSIESKNVAAGDILYVLGELGSTDVRGTLHVRNLVSSATVMNGGSALVSAGGTVNSAAVSAGGKLDVRGTVDEVTLAEGNASAVDGGTVGKGTVNGGKMDVATNGTINSVTISSGGSVIVSGGSAKDTTVEAWGEMTLSAGKAENTTVNNLGHFQILGGSAVNTDITEGGSATVSSGGKADFVTVSSGGGFNVVSAEASVVLEINMNHPIAERLVTLYDVDRD
ncbi:MAG: AIDA repeat-containing protein, partial [Lentisphaeria bacterium]|nr:AIDA repeat-containing protein [Lentisphaeria bacterium]